jgi:hypothetical protein
VYQSCFGQKSEISGAEAPLDLAWKAEKSGLSFLDGDTSVGVNGSLDNLMRFRGSFYNNMGTIGAWLEECLAAKFCGIDGDWTLLGPNMEHVDHMSEEERNI